MRRIGVISFSVWLPLVAKEIDQAFGRFRGATESSSTCVATQAVSRAW